MRKGETAKKAEKLTIYILILSIICLILMSFLPWILVTENDYVKQDLHFNFEMMKESGNGDILRLAGDLNLINISFWILIILSVLSFLGAIIHISRKFPIAGHILLLLGCVTFVVSIFVVILQIIIIQNIGKLDTISASALYPPINFSYFLLIPSVVIFIYSALYTLIVFVHSIQKFISNKKKKADKKEKKIDKKQIKKDYKIQEKEIQKKDITQKEKTSSEHSTDEKSIEMEHWLAGQVENIEKKAVDDKKKLEKEKISKELKKESKEAYEFPPEKTKEETKEPKELQTSPSFENTLSYAIQKNQTEKISKKDLADEELTSKIEESTKERLNVRCPQCKNIFTVEKKEGVTEIKCPKCSKEGFIK